VGWLPVRWLGIAAIALLLVGSAVFANTLRGAAPAAPGATAVATSAPVAAAATTRPTIAPTTAPTAQPTIAPTVAVAQNVAPTPTAAPAPAPPVTSQQTAGPFRAYVVRPGDTVRFIATTFGVSPASIVQASGLKNADQLRVGQVLTIPDQPGWLYRVQPGDTLDQIAARTGVPSQLIASASNLAAPTVVPGDVLLIPDVSVASARGK
jgi:LysM repeat protein